MRKHIQSKGSVLLFVFVVGLLCVSILLLINPYFRTQITSYEEQTTNSTAQKSPISLADPYVSISGSAKEKTISLSAKNISPVSSTTPVSKPQALTSSSTSTDTSVKTVSQKAPLFPEKYLSHTSGELSARKVIDLTNQERQKDGRSVLKENASLDQAAIAKINDMFDNHYFEHVAPMTGRDVVYWVGQVGYMYISVGENLAMGEFQDEEEMVTAWMNSLGHRENILKSSYEEIGVAVGRGTYQGNSVWMGVQIFGIPASACPVVDKDLLAAIDVAESLVKNIEKDIVTLSPAVSNAIQPQTQEEYDVYLADVKRYNDLVDQHKSAVAHMSTLVDTYNKGVRDYNACLSGK